MTNRASNMKDLIEDKNNPERMFPILNKFDRIWTVKSTMTFQQVYADITKGTKGPVSDLQFTQLMEQYIDKNNIK